MSSNWDWPAEEFKNEPDKLEKHYAERAKSGFSTFDWWNFDMYIAGVIAAAVKKFSTGHGYPGTFRDTEEFEEFCKSIYEPLEFYTTHEYGRLKADEQAIAYEAALDAMKKFSENLGGWWD